MDFREYLSKKHLLKEGEKELKPISVEQYINRFENMCKAGVYNGETQNDCSLRKKIQERYKDWPTYERTIKYYLDSKKFQH